jgi:ribosomal protein L4
MVGEGGEGSKKVRELAIKFSLASRRGEEGWRALAAEVFSKRLKWYDEVKHKLDLKGSDVEKALRLLMLKVGIREEEVKIVYKSERKIVFRSFNRCPVIKACEAVGLETREVCKKVYERSTEEFIRLVNPNLRFYRNYERIRPYAEYCEEIIELV